MAKGKEARSEFTAGFLGRTIAARALKYETQQEMADDLMGPGQQPTYSKYESRTPLPHYLMDRFCKICSVRLEWLITAQGPGPAWQPVYPEDKKQRQPRKTKTRTVKKA